MFLLLFVTKSLLFERRAQVDSLCPSSVSVFDSDIDRRLLSSAVRPKSAEPVIPVAKSEHKSPKRTRPRAPRDLPVHGHGDLSGRKKAYKQSKWDSIHIIINL